MLRGLWEQGFEGQHGCFMYHSDCKQAMRAHSLFLIIEPFLHNVNASMGEVYYGELIKGSEIGAHMACPWGIASIMAALRLVCTQRLRLNVKYVYTVIGYKDCDPPFPPLYLYLRKEVLIPLDCLYFPHIITITSLGLTFC